MLSAKIKAVANRRGQITGCWHQLVFTASNVLPAERINIMSALNNKVRCCTSAGCENYRNMLLSRSP